MPSASSRPSGVAWRSAKLRIGKSRLRHNLTRWPQGGRAIVICPAAAPCHLQKGSIMRTRLRLHQPWLSHYYYYYYYYCRNEASRPRRRRPRRLVVGLPPAGHNYNGTHQVERPFHHLHRRRVRAHGRWARPPRRSGRSVCCQPGLALPGTRRCKHHSGEALPPRALYTRSDVIAPLTNRRGGVAAFLRPPLPPPSDLKSQPSSGAREISRFLGNTGVYRQPPNEDSAHEFLCSVSFLCPALRGAPHLPNPAPLG